MKTESQKTVRFGLIGLGLMGREFASSVARWCHLLTDGPRPVLTAVCDPFTEKHQWYTDNFPSIEMATTDHHDVLAAECVDAVYCAVPHNMHQQLYTDILKADKHLLGEKPFGIDQAANTAILEECARHPDLVVRSSSEFPYFPAAQRLLQWLREKQYGRLMEVHCGFHHSSDMDLNKPINWKRQVEVNGAYGCMGDLGMHAQHIPFRMGWDIKNVYADLRNIATTRPDGKGKQVACETWDNATILCDAIDPTNEKDFLLTFETKRMAPGATNTWFITVHGTEGSAKFTTHDPKAFYCLESGTREQGWTRYDIGVQSAIPSVTGGIFEFGFSDAFQQMLGAFMAEFSATPEKHPFRTVSAAETALSHKVLTAALESHTTGTRIPVCLFEK